MWPTKPKNLLSGPSQENCWPRITFAVQLQGLGGSASVHFAMRCRENIVIFDYSKQILEMTHAISLIVNILFILEKKMSINDTEFG